MPTDDDASPVLGGTVFHGIDHSLKRTLRNPGGLADGDVALRLLMTQDWPTRPTNRCAHYWAGLVAYEAADIDRTFRELDLALANGFSKEKHFIADEPALGALRASHTERFQAMLDRY